jgi:hypothetical protein
MDDDTHRQLFDPATAQRLVLAHRPEPRTAVTAVVSDTVWREVVGLLRWATATTGGAPGLESGRWWRLAAGCADLLRRLPALGDEAGEPWRPAIVTEDPTSTGVRRVTEASDRLLALLLSAEPVALPRLAAGIDALGAAAVGVLAEEASWTVPGRTS